MITPENWKQIRALFLEAADRPAAERETYLRSVPDVDDEVRREVESLLEANQQAEGFLDVPAIESLGAEPSSSAPALTPGCRLGAFEILGPLGAGGMGEVHRARDTRLDRTVAIKVLTPELAENPRNRERFEREARLVSRLNHPGICTLHDVGSALLDGRVVRFLVMELLDGETLAARLRRGPLPLDQALRFGLDIVAALGAIHALGIVHRDLKPANIMLTASGVKLLDFGLARLRTPADMVPDDPLTVEGLVLGTVPYMAPEQLRGEDVDARADLFAFGAVLHEMVTGRRAFAADSEAALIAAILDQDPPALRTQQPDAPVALAALVAACLAKDPNDRWQHARDVALALEGIARARAAGEPPVAAGSHRPATASRSRRLHAAWAAVAVAAGLSGWWLGPGATGALPPANPRPVIVLMDSPLPGRVYDPRTLAGGGTNADDVSDALRDLAVVTYKENTSAMWHREEQVRAENPDLIISHLSCLLDERVAKADAEIADHLFEMAQQRLTSFFGYLNATNPRTRFLVYSRGRFAEEQPAAAWRENVLARFPRLKGRLFVMSVPGGSSATFRDPATASLLRSRVTEILGQP
jgi:hypothetical protein